MNEKLRAVIAEHTAQRKQPATIGASSTPSTGRTSSSSSSRSSANLSPADLARQLARLVRTAWADSDPDQRARISTDHDPARALPRSVMEFSQTFVEILDQPRADNAERMMRTRHSNDPPADIDERVRKARLHREKEQEKHAVLLGSWLLSRVSSDAKPALLGAITRLAGQRDEKSVSALGKLLNAVGLTTVGRRRARALKAARQAAADPAARLHQNKADHKYITVALEDNMDKAASTYSRVGTFNVEKATMHATSLVVAQIEFPADQW